jgi:DNA-directed RNA polymerase specialized sigma24 family protein
VDSLSTVGWTRISKLRVNDHQVWQEVCDHYDPLLRRFVSRRLQRDGSDNQVNDVLSDTWAAIYETLTQKNGLSKFESGQHEFRKYLFGTARNKINDIFRRQSSRRDEDEDLADPQKGVFVRRQPSSQIRVEDLADPQKGALDLLIDEELFTLFEFVKRDLLIDGGLTQKQISIVEDVAANDSGSLDHIARKHEETNNNISQIYRRAMGRIATRFRQVHEEFSE